MSEREKMGNVDGGAKKKDLRIKVNFVLKRKPLVNIAVYMRTTLQNYIHMWDGHAKLLRMESIMDATENVSE